MSMPLYAAPEQVMRDRSEYARKGIARGRSVIVLIYADGVLFVAENASSTLHKLSEIYDRIGFAAVGRYSEFENLRTAGIRFADVRGYQNDPRDVTGRSLANVYAQTLGTIFTEQLKPFEVELCVAEVGTLPEQDQMYRLTYDGSIVDEPEYVVMGGQADTISTAVKESYREAMPLSEAVEVAVRALSSGSQGLPAGELLGMERLEVAVLERARPRRAFRRIAGAALSALLPTVEAPEPPADEAEKPATEEKPAAKPKGSADKPDDAK
ncbi:proteasome subunit alpha [Solihabitans fulvus]|uniref:Proteasome subunit alpha n=1 Tax=Solihabitans fulvus TaxID=1892852 RepID=A0A5B2XUT5_9PSEU|nr:proteasome subunit alpha [Solihabitans fulvus]KAA2266511.1 proteasome subunit alpha [Solihabitans fulvus]